MLQQTQVATVIPYYERFLARFKTVAALASAPEEEVLRLWSGLGYYARGRNLHGAARLIAKDGFPRTAREIAELPGIGRSTAAAIAVFAYGERAAILDGNAKRVLARSFALSDEDALWRLAEGVLPKRHIETYTQALMDLGAAICTRVKPRCAECPVKGDCAAREQGSTDRFPAPRARRALPVRKVTWWVLLRNGRVLLEKRPGSGLWGGLLTFPEVAQTGWQIAARRRLPVVEHGFTHFRLRATPILCTVEGARPTNEQQWLALDRAAKAAVPTPVKTLLYELARVRAPSPN
jgi:A/G-specific adenine glycosylase